MTGERFREYIFHPAFISFLLLIIVILLLPPVFSKYTVRYLKCNRVNDYLSIFYSDLDSDGNSEMISFDLTDKERTKIIVYKDNKIVNQHNIRYQPSNLSSILLDDYNHDNYLEIFVFTVDNDSIFLNIIDPLKSRKVILANRFIDSWKKANFSTNNPIIKSLSTIDAGEPFSDLFFIIITGYPLKPRKFYRYIIDRDSLLRSPDAGFIINSCAAYDLDNDHLPEFLPNIQAAGNYDEGFPYTDRFSWFLIFDHQAKFTFEPVKVHPNPSNTFLTPVFYNGKIHIAAFLRYLGSENLNSSLCLFDIDGNKINEKPVDNFDPLNAIIFNGDYARNQTFFFFRNPNGDVEELNSQLRIVKKITIPPVLHTEPLTFIDTDGDGRKEYIFVGSDNRSLIFVRDNFRDPVLIKFDLARFESDEVLISEYLEKGKRQSLYLQSRGLGIFLRYQKNLFYYLKYPLYFAIYASILAFISLLSYIQSHRLRQKQETEKRIATLQMKAIKNQIDPHFTLNILNSIGALYSTAKNKQKADYLFGKYASLIRQTVISSDNIIVPLSDEIDFIRNYLDLERFRNENSFDYSIEIEDIIDLQARIPRTLIHTFVENAVKYGVRQREKDGMIRIRIRNQNGSYEIIIEDNGPGISKDEHQGTGKGLRILDELVDLYFKLEKSRIIYSLENISENNKTVSGTRAIIKIQKQKG